MTFAPTAFAQPRPAEREGVSYQDQTVQLARVLGGSHYLRITCSGRDDQRWRDAMRGIISREGESGALTAAFNEGYRQEESRFPSCDRGAQQMERELRAQGIRLANSLAVRNAGDRGRSGQ
ncbi:MAG: TIGR02301 family protein [Hyphomonadaceae bacterium]